MLPIEKFGNFLNSFRTMVFYEKMAKLMIAAQARAYAGSAAGDARGALDVPTWHDVLAHKLGEHRQKVLMHGGAVAVR